jgi:hypothetical protein
VVAGETRLIVGHPVDEAAADEEVGDRVRFSVAMDNTAGGLDRREGRFIRKASHGPIRELHAALVRSIRMEIDGRCRQTNRGPGGCDGTDDLRKSSGVVSMPMREEHQLD